MLRVLFEIKSLTTFPLDCTGAWPWSKDSDYTYRLGVGRDVVAAMKGCRALQCWSLQQASNLAPLSITDHKMGYTMSILYVGGVWRLGDATILDDSNVCETQGSDGKFTAQEHKIIPVNISVSWGGEWAFPSK